MRKNLVLLGMMGVGKTTIGKIVAKKQGLVFVDTDTNIEKKCSMKISEIFRKKGEKFFRIEEEKEVLKSLTKSANLFKCDKLIIANFLLDEFFWCWKIYFIKQKYSY